MKRSTILFVFAVLLVFSVSVGAKGMSDSFEFIGGVTYTTISSDELDDLVDFSNKWFDDQKEEIESFGYETEVSKMDEINGGFGFYLGGCLPINEKTKIGGIYERISVDSEGSIKVPDASEEVKTKIELPLNGLVGTASYGINEYLAVKGGLGYYFGELSSSRKYYYNGIEMVLDDVTYENKTDVKGFGFKFGADVDYPVNEQMSIIGAANYRILSLEADDELWDGDEIGFNGLELKGGVSFKF